jgi:hypothetical protein
MGVSGHMEYPAELAVGDKTSKNSELAKFFKARGWSYTWDFDDSGYWYEVMYNGRIQMQIEFDVPVKELVKTLKEFVPKLNEKILSKSSLDCVHETIGQQNLYIFNGDKPKWDGTHKRKIRPWL